MYFETIAGDNELVIEQEKKFDKKLNSNEDESYLLALKLHEELNGCSFEYDNKDLKIIDERWELIDPTPDVYKLFNEFNFDFFSEKLSSVFVEWSKQMTNCAGICIYEPKENFCRIVLSEPLLKLRPRKDLVQTLLHEMIHAYLFVTKNRKDRNEHGSEFLKHMIQINQATGANITIYHKFLDEVDHYRQHWWRCTGSCQNWKPFYGYVKRSINRSPSKNDRWFDEHQYRCNGQFIKIKGPLNEKKSKNNVYSLPQPSTKKVKILSVDQITLDKFVDKPTAFAECQFCRENVHKANLQLHLDMKCQMRVK